MTKQQIIDKINAIFGSLNNFFRWCGDKNPVQSAYAFKKSKKVSNSLLKHLDCIESIVNVDIKQQADIRDSVKTVKKF